MVNVIDEIVVISGAPHKITKTERTCDLCGAHCTSSNGARHERLYKYNGDEMCFECLFETLLNDGTVEEVE